MLERATSHCWQCVQDCFPACRTPFSSSPSSMRPPHGSPQAILVIAFAVLVAILLGLSDAEQTLAVLGTSSWPLFVTLGVLGGGLSFVLYIVGLKHTAPAAASILAMVEPVTASLFGVVVLDENLAAMQILGMALILLTVTALGVHSRNPN